MRIQIIEQTLDTINAHKQIQKESKQERGRAAPTLEDLKLQILYQQNKILPKKYQKPFDHTHFRPIESPNQYEELIIAINRVMGRQ